MSALLQGSSTVLLEGRWVDWCTAEAGFQVRYEVRDTDFGLGLFVMEPVDKGTLVWRQMRGVNSLGLTGEQETRLYLAGLTPEGRKEFLEFAWHGNGTLNLDLDDGRYNIHAVIHPSISQVPQPLG